MGVVVNLGGIKVGSLASDCGIFIGENMQNGWDSHSKANTGVGAIAGDYNVLTVYLALLNDPDIIDVPIFDNDVKSPALGYFQGV
ncbi:MAG: hypothetical protein OWT28_07380 [Firmicutes bacterium]|nr:hypothetical protein [Bacillota bacterium]